MVAVLIYIPQTESKGSLSHQCLLFYCLRTIVTLAVWHLERKINYVWEWSWEAFSQTGPCLSMSLQESEEFKGTCSKVGGLDKLVVTSYGFPLESPSSCWPVSIRTPCMSSLEARRGHLSPLPQSCTSASSGRSGQQVQGLWISSVMLWKAVPSPKTLNCQQEPFQFISLWPTPGFTRAKLI